ncbi:Protein SIEVE ELEMENT OCCLUSION B [Camellia lanceoleosa]|uniref:Protein SIEVE ELEMENT OCCLUSION B n=1 Tax=Camellia lanceoleosa TaxID=1840588 RepID=A0ACC0G7R2_9ERIC|nr:Protein SIEVE ELEMENT OCCLUSION B [Camellia lanceoleosa]
MTSKIVPTGGTMHQIGSDSNLISKSASDKAMMEQIQATHSPDGREFDVKLLLYVIEDILHHATSPSIPGLGLADISSKCSEGLDSHTITLALLKILSSFSWDAKVVIALAAFSMNYSRLWLLLGSNPLASSLVQLTELTQLPDMIKRTDSLKLKFEAMTNLIKVMLDVTKCIVEFKELPSQYIALNPPEMVAATASISIAVYWTLRSIVACALQIKYFIGMRLEHMAKTEEDWDLSSLAQKLTNIHNHLQKQLDLCLQFSEEKGDIERFQGLVKLLQMTHIDNLKILKSLIYAKDDQLPLVDGSTKRRVSPHIARFKCCNYKSLAQFELYIDVLRRKNVLLLISNLDFSHEEHFILGQMYTKSRQHPTTTYEVVWVPIVDRTTPWDEVEQRKFKSIQVSMPWFSVHHPSLLDPTAIKYIKEVWHFNKKPLLVVLDPHGKVVNPNAIHMCWIWGNMAFPCTTLTEEALWEGSTWTIELLADSIDQSILNWIKDGKYICLYGGENLDWIRRFTNRARVVAEAAGILLEMMYVGKNNPRKKVWKISNVILAEKLSHILPDPTLIWFFWVRLESMWHSKMQHGKTIENDPIMNEITTILSFDGSDKGWAVISQGKSEMAKAKGDAILKSLALFDQWKDRIGEVGFVNALNDNLNELLTPQHCDHLIFPCTAENIPETIVCATCKTHMEKFIMYRCCRD